MGRIGIITADPGYFTAEDPDYDTGPLIAALDAKSAGLSTVVDRLTVESVVWDDDSVDWSSFDLLVIRSPWDYVHKVAEFLSWLEKIEKAEVPLINNPSLIRWNMDKAYLNQLSDCGIPVIPTHYLNDGRSITETLQSMESSVVIKPTVGAGASWTGLFNASDPAAKDLADQILALGGTVMLQAEIPELSAGHEKALYQVDGQFTHAISKGALLAHGGGYLGGVYQEHPEIVAASEEEKVLADRVMTAAADITGTERPLYGRIDMVDSAEHGLLVLEAEVFEPALQLHLVPEVAEIVADGILDRLLPASHSVFP